MSQQTDLEIYLFNSTPATIKAWLEGVFDIVEFDATSTQKVISGTACLDNRTIQIKLYTNAMGRKVACLWFENNKLPWAEDIDCARAASKALNIEVRCAQSSWKEGDDAQSEWWKIVDGEETSVEW